MQNKTWTPQKNLNYFSRQSPSKLRNIRQPQSLLGESISKAHHSRILDISVNKNINSSRKSKSNIFSRKIQDTFQANNFSQPISKNEENFILIQDQSEEQMHRQTIMSDWISIDKIAQKVIQKKQEEELKEKNNREIQKQMKPRVNKDKTNDAKNSKKSKGNNLSKTEDRQLTRQFSFGTPIHAKAVTQSSSEGKTNNYILNKFYDEQALRKLQQKQKKHEFLTKRKHQQFKKHLNSRKNAKTELSKSQDKDVSWKQFINKMLKKNSRKPSEESIKEFLSFHQDFSSQKNGKPAELKSINQKSQHKQKQKQKSQHYHKSQDYENHLQVSQSNDSIINKLQNEDQKDQHDMRPTSTTQDQVPVFRYKANEVEYTLTKSQNQLLQEEWEQVQKNHKIDYVAKPRSENLHQRSGQTKTKNRRNLFKAMKQEPIVVPQIPDINEMPLHRKSLDMLVQSMRQLPASLTPVYMSIYEKVLQTQVQNEVKLQQQHMIINVLQCMIALNRQKLRAEDYLLSEETRTDQQKVIKMNQVIIGGLIRKMVSFL